MNTTTTTATARFDDPVPKIAATRKAIFEHVIRDAIDAFEDAHRRYFDYSVAIDDDYSQEVIDGLINKRLDDARNHLVRALLARTVNCGYKEAMTLENRVHKTTGVISGGRFYLASVDEGYSLNPVGDDPDGEPIMKLVHGDMADLATAVADADEIQDMDRE